MQQASPSFAPDLARGHLIVQKQRKNLGAVIAVTAMAIVLIAGAQWIWIAVYPVTPTGIAFVVIGVLLLVVSAVANMLLVQRLASRFPEVKGAVWQGIVFGMVVPLLGAFCCILPVSFGQIEAGSSNNSLPMSFIVLIAIVFILPSIQCITLAYNAASVDKRFGPGAAAQLWHFQQWQLGQQVQFLNTQYQARWWATAQAQEPAQAEQPYYGQPEQYRTTGNHTLE